MLTCIWCDHAETSDATGYDAMADHMVDQHACKQRCGCAHDSTERRPTWWVCETHEVAHLRFITGRIIANYQAQRFAPAQPTLLGGGA